MPDSCGKLTCATRTLEEIGADLFGALSIGLLKSPLILRNTRSRDYESLINHVLLSYAIHHHFTSWPHCQRWRPAENFCFGSLSRDGSPGIEYNSNETAAVSRLSSRKIVSLPSFQVLGIFFSFVSFEKHSRLDSRQSTSQRLSQWITLTNHTTQLKFELTVIRTNAAAS